MEFVPLSVVGFLPETKVVLIRSGGKNQESVSGKLVGEIKIGEPMPLPTFRNKVTGIYLLNSFSLMIVCGNKTYQLTVMATGV